MIQSNNEIKELILKAQSGDRQAKEELVKFMADNGCMAIIGRYLTINKLLEPADAKSEFWIGVILALPKVRMDIGDPLQYLMWKGETHAISALRKIISNSITAVCKDCGLRFKLYRVGSNYICRRCSSIDLETFPNEINLTTFTSNSEKETTPDIGIIDDVDTSFKLDLETFSSLLSRQELCVYNLITKENVNRFYVNNYIEEIATRMQISQQCVSIYIKRIRMKLKDYLKENDSI